MVTEVPLIEGDFSNFCLHLLSLPSHIVNRQVINYKSSSYNPKNIKTCFSLVQDADLCCIRCHLVQHKMASCATLLPFSRFCSTNEEFFRIRGETMPYLFSVSVKIRVGSVGQQAFISGTSLLLIACTSPLRWLLSSWNSAS